MKIIYVKKFKKKFQKLKSGEKKKFEERVGIFIKNAAHPTLNDHPLHGKFSRCRSFNVTGDLRVLYELAEKGVALFIDIDTHSNLYQ
ncbi:MAG: type II toxin-antitoxin system mRNA interferase toxin, RelE/StbE family [Parcubacteria group bacterium]|nr:type II toxin-antitoxin system mRNA interferase toxin, RelE/StbE family [Parcubacteria group bacterium]